MNNRNKIINRAISIKFAQELDKIKLERVKLGRDNIKQLKSDWRLTLAIIRHPTFQQIKSDLIIEELKDE